MPWNNGTLCLIFYPGTPHTVFKDVPGRDPIFSCSCPTCSRHRRLSTASQRHGAWIVLPSWHRSGHSTDIAMDVAATNAEIAVSHYNMVHTRARGQGFLNDITGRLGPVIRGRSLRDHLRHGHFHIRLHHETGALGGFWRFAQSGHRYLLSSLTAG